MAVLFRKEDGTLVRFPNGTTPEEIEQALAQETQQAPPQEAQQPMTPQQQAREGAKQTFSELPWYGKMATGAASTFAQPVLGVAQLAQQGAERLGIPVSEEMKQDLSERIGTVRGAREGSGGWGTAGEIAAFVPGAFAKAPAAFARFAPGIFQRAVPRAALIGGAEQGAFEGLRSRTEDEGTGLGARAVDAAIGTVGGGIGGAAGPLTSAFFGGRRGSQAAQQLYKEAADAGVPLRLSPGQHQGPLSLRNAVEEHSMNLPIVRRIVSGQRGQGVADWNLMHLNRAAREIDPSASIREAGHKGVEELQGMVNNAYRNAVRGVSVQVPDAIDDPAIKRVQTKIGDLLPEDQVAAQSIVDRLAKQLESGNITGDSLIEVRSGLAQEASGLYRQGRYTLGKVVDELSDAFDNVLERNMPAANREMLQRANAAYRRLVPIQRASAFRGAQMNDMFTPNQLVAGATRGGPDSVVARQGIPIQREALLAEEVFGNTIPSMGPGTAEKLMMSALLTGTGAAIAGGGEQFGLPTSPLMGAGLGLGLATLGYAPRGPGWRQNVGGLLGQVARPAASRAGALLLDDQFAE